MMKVFHVGTETVVDKAFAAAWGRPAGERDDLRRRLVEYLFWGRGPRPKELDEKAAEDRTIAEAMSGPRTFGPLGEEFYG